MQLPTRLAYALLVTTLLLSGPPPAAANIVVSNNIVEFDGGDKSDRHADVVVTNAGKERQYVVVEPHEILAAGTAEERSVDRADPADLGLLVTPPRMVLEPGEAQVVRLVRLASPLKEDRVYRIGIRPVVGELDTRETAVKVLIGYTALVVIRPKNAESRVTYERDGDTLRFRNDGNTNALLVGGEQCDEAGGRCARLGAHRLYAGNRWEIEVPHATAAEYTIVDNEGSRRVRLTRR